MAGQTKSSKQARTRKPTALQPVVQDQVAKQLKRRNLNVMMYLCGDQEWITGCLKENVENVRQLEPLANIWISVQWDRYVGGDCKEGSDNDQANSKSANTQTTRFVVGDGEIHFETNLGEQNTGNTQVAKDFFQWSMTRCPSDQLAIIFAGTGIGHARSVIGDVDTQQDFQKIFSFCDDITGNDALSPNELRQILESVVEERNNQPIDLVAFDMNSIQFIEIAYQLDGLASFMVGSQNNEFGPDWQYDEILKSWDDCLKDSEKHARGSLRKHKSIELAEKAVEIVGKNYPLRGEEDPFRPMVSALNLSQLERVTRATDTLFVALLLSLGDDVIWNVREEVFAELKRHYKKLVESESSNQSNKRNLISYDLAHLLKTLFDKFSDYARDGEKTEASELRFWCRKHVANFQEKAKENKRPVDKEKKRFLGQLGGILTSIQNRVSALTTETNQSWTVENDVSYDKLKKELELEIHCLSEGVKAFRRAEKSVMSSDDAKGESADPAYKLTATTVEIAKEVVDGYEEFQAGHLTSSIENATRLRELAGVVLKLFQPADQEGSGRLILARAPEYKDRCGLSIFRPEKLDNLIHSQYLELDFHSRVHWVALLGAINLIINHPREMWRLISSLLSKSGGAAREELLRQLVGRESVLTGLGDQFRALKQPPSVTLSISKRTNLDGKADSSDDDNSEDDFDSLIADQKVEHYQLRLDSSRQGATIVQQDSRVNPRTINNALSRLEELLKSGTGSRENMESLESLGRTLGEDIIQRLNVHLKSDWHEIEMFEPDDVLHMQLQLPRELMRFPWELMHDGEKFLCERYALGRQVFMETGLSRRPGPRKPDAIHALVIGDPIFDEPHRRYWHQLPGAREEAKEVANLFEKLNDDLRGTLKFERHRDVLIQERVTTHQLRRLIRSGKYDIIHFAGHAQYDAKDPERSAWMLSDGPLWALEIRNTLAHCESPPWMVYANACESGMDSGETPLYQTNVFGLATAFINEGVTAYIGPLWPISDAVALRMAVDFYSELLLERATLGEALRFAKCSAKHATSDPEAQVQSRTSLSWASVIQYGDPTMKLLDSFGSTDTSDGQEKKDKIAKVKARERRDARRGRRRKASGLRATRPLQASVQETQQLVFGPGMEADRLTFKRSTAEIAKDKWVLELAEVNGTRYWQFMDNDTSQPKTLHGSEIQDVVGSNERLRARFGLEPGLFDYPRIIGRWLIPVNDHDQIEEIVQQYDADTVACEQLQKINSDGSLNPLKKVGLRWVKGRLAGGESDRVLLIIHDTLSKTQTPVDALGDEFIRWACRHYAAVVGFDHHTLSVSPEDNARKLWQLLDPTLKRIKNSIDIISLGRGGLVARSLIELFDDWQKRGPATAHRSVSDVDGEPKLLTPSDVINKVFFAGTPNAGTDIADEDNIGRAADLLINLVHIDPSGTFAKLGGLLARLAAPGNASLIRTIPGLWAQSTQARRPQDLLGRLQLKTPPHEKVSYWVIASNYEPNGELNVKRVLEQVADYRLDEFFKSGSIDENNVCYANDLLVNTAHVWSMNNEPGNHQLPAWLKNKNPERVLLFNSERNAMTPPEGIKEIRRSGVHHTNLLSIPEAGDFLKKNLLSD